MVAQPACISDEPSVLVTDDSDAWREAVREVLAREGLRTFEAACGEEAIELVRTRHLDLVLMDFHMPRLDGLETIRRIRREGADAPAVLMTGRPKDVPRVDLARLRITTILAKPADRRRIVTVVMSVVRHRP